MNNKELSVKEIIATANSYKYLTDFIAYDPDVYALSREKGCYQKAVKDIRNFCRWSEELVIEVAKFYTDVVDFKNNDKEAFQSAKKNGWLQRATAHMCNGEKIAA